MTFFKKIILISMLITVNTFFFLKNVSSTEVRIIIKVNEEILTNVDVENEFKYLVTLNKSLGNMNKKAVMELAKDSLIKEIIKKIELDKFYVLNKKNESVDLMISNIYRSLNLSSEKEFKDYLESVGLDFDSVYNKIEIETVWNQMIYEKYKNKVVIDEKKLKEQVLKYQKDNVETLLLNEIVFDFKSTNEKQKKYQEILKSIEINGFEETVIKYSISNTKTKSGLVGWVNINTLNDKIKNEIVNLEIGEISNPITVPSGVLLLKVSDKKIEKIEINVNKELNRLIEIELTNQLNNYSTIHFNKIKSNQFINEY
tara:strand:+ start:112 stop:1053 length:942 start_codon:yes stop_codon:yes gene_type:complete